MSPPPKPGISGGLWDPNASLYAVLCPVSHSQSPILKVSIFQGQEASARLQSGKVFPVPMPPSTPRFLSEVRGREGWVQLSWDCISYCEQRFGRQTAAVVFPLVCVHLLPFYCLNTVTQHVTSGLCGCLIWDLEPLQSCSRSQRGQSHERSCEECGEKEISLYISLCLLENSWIPCVSISPRGKAYFL